MATTTSTIKPLLDNWVLKRKQYLEIKANPNSTTTEITEAENEMNSAKTLLDSEIETKSLLNIIKLLFDAKYFNKP